MSGHDSTRRPVSAKSLQAMKKTLIEDLKLDKGVKSVFIKLISSDRNKDNLDLHKKTQCGDTMLHRLVYASVDTPGNMKYYKEIVDRIFSRSKKNKDKGENKFYSASIKLLEGITDESERNVWDLAFQKVAIDMIEILMNMQGVTYDDENNYFDVSNFVYMSFKKGNIFNRLCSCFCFKDQHVEKLPTLLQKANNENKFDELMRVKPLKKLTDIFCSINTKIYIVVVFLHIVYMSLFSYLGCELMDARNPKPTDTTKGLMYSFGLVEPILLSFYLLNKLFKLVLLKVSSSDLDKMNYKYRKISYVREIVWFIITLLHIVLLWSVIASVGSEITQTRRNILSVCLLLGWLLTFALANGIKQIHFFYKLVIRVIFTDVLKILLVYIIFLLGFSLAVHAQFISSADITMTYETPIHTVYLMFNVMIGMQEAVDENTETYLEAVSASPLFSKILYIGYVLCSTIVLLNLLIAMMNTSYSTIEIEHLNEWLIDAVHFGIITAIYLRAIAKVLGLQKIQKRKLSEHYTESVWTIEVPNDYPVYDKRQSERIKYKDKDLGKLGHEIEHSEKILKAQIFNMQRAQSEMMKSQSKMMKCIKDLQARMDKRTQYRSRPEETPRSTLGEHIAFTKTK